jgi:hypothetical protein
MNSRIEKIKDKLNSMLPDEGRYGQVFQAMDWEEVRSWGQGFHVPTMLWTKQQIEDYGKEIKKEINIDIQFISIIGDDKDLPEPVLYEPGMIQAYYYDTNWRPIANMGEFKIKANELNLKYGFGVNENQGRMTSDYGLIGTANAITQ